MTSFINALEWWQWALITGAAIASVGLLLPGVFLPSFKLPLQGTKFLIILLPFYATSNFLLLLLNGTFESTQVPIIADLFAAITFAGIICSRQSWALRTSRPISLGLLLFVTVSCLSTVNTTAPQRSTISIITYAQLLLITYCIESVVTNEERVKIVWRYWYWSYLVVLVFGVLGIATIYLGIKDVANINGIQVISTFRFPNQLSLYLILTAPLMWSVATLRSTPKTVRRILSWSMPVMLAVLWYSGSRSGVAGFIAVAATLMVLTRQVRILLIGGLVCVVIGVFLFSLDIGTAGNFAKGSSRYATMLAALQGEDVKSPFGFYETGENVAIDAFVQHPALGGGIGAVLDYQTTAGQPYEVHNTFVGVAGQTGTFGLVISLGIMLCAARNAWRARVEARSPFLKALANGCLAALVGFIIHGLGNFDWRIRHVWLLLAFTSGVFVAARRSLRPAGQVAVTKTTRVYPDIRVAARAHSPQ
jgi:O-antigen ligase